MSNRRLIWWICAIATFCLFFFIIPPSVYNKAAFIFSLIGAALLTFFLAQAFWDFKSFQEFNKPTPEQKHSGHKLAPFLVIPGIIMLFVFYLNSASNEKNEIKKDGVITTAIVSDGYSKTSRNSTLYYVTLKYKAENGTEYSQEESVNQSEFHKLFIGAEVPVMYSKKNPELVEVIMSDEAIKEFMGIENKNLSFANLYELYDKPTDSIQKYLNTISYKWSMEKDSGRIMWENKNKDEFISRSILGTLTYISKSPGESGELTDILKNEGFKKIKQDSTGLSIYENKNYRLSYKIKREIEEGTFIYSSYQIINMLKINHDKK